MLRASPRERRGIEDKGEPAASSASPQFFCGKTNLWSPGDQFCVGNQMAFFLSSQHLPLTKLNPQFRTRAEGLPHLLPGVDTGTNTRCPVTFFASSLCFAGDTPSFGPWFGKKFMFLAHVYVFPTLSISYVLIHLTLKTDCDIIIVVVVPSLSCPTLCNPMDCSTPGFPVLYRFLKFAQTHGH